MIPANILAYALSHWRTIATGAVIAVLSLLLILARGDARHQAGLYAQEKAAHAQTVTNYRLASEQAQADDLAHARDVETRDAAIALEKQNALETQLATARGNLAAYVRLHAATGAHQGSGTKPDLPNAANPSSGAPDPTADAIVPIADLDLCARATVMAQGWQAWWAEVSAQPR